MKTESWEPTDSHYVVYHRKFSGSRKVRSENYLQDEAKTSKIVNM